MTHLWIKICGIGDEQAAQAACRAGADALGFVFAPSPRRVDPGTARRIAASVRAGVAGRRPPALVGVFVNAPLDQVLSTADQVGLTHVQLHGDEPEDQVPALQAAGLTVIRAVRPRGSLPALALGTQADLVLVDAWDPGQRGGTGRTGDWQMAARLARRRPVILAGGLTVDNVARALDAVRPWGVDVSSGVERARGVKDPDRIAEFVRMARDSWQETLAGAGMTAGGHLPDSGSDRGR